MNTHTEIARITEELRALYHADNDAPLLIAEMIKHEFPKSFELATQEYTYLIEDLESQLEDNQLDSEELIALRMEIRELKRQIEELESYDE